MPMQNPAIAWRRKARLNAMEVLSARDGGIPVEKHLHPGLHLPQSQQQIKQQAQTTSSDPQEELQSLPLVTKRVRYSNSSISSLFIPPFLKFIVCLKRVKLINKISLEQN
jgi:hypothetical protein